MKLYLIAGESSGDRLGAGLMKALKAQENNEITFGGIGGPLMQKEGLKSLFPMQELSLMGIFEILPKVSHLLKRIHETVSAIEEFDPDAVITIDSPEFSFRVLENLKKRGKSRARRIHYVAPSVWAWRPGRAQKIARFLDGIICLFPFEPPYFLKYQLRAIYTGHPLIQENPDKGDGAAFRIKNQIPEAAKTLGVFFGSRQSELARHKKTLLTAIGFLKEKYPQLHLIIPTLPHLEYDLLEALKGAPCDFTLCVDASQKWDAFRACDAAVAVSGTVGLELAYAGVPHLIGYKTSLPTFFLLKLLLNVKYAHLANIILNEGIVPEYLQKDFEYEKIHNGIVDLFENKESRLKQESGFQRLRKTLSIEDKQSPSAKAAYFISKLIQ